MASAARSARGWSSWIGKYRSSVVFWATEAFTRSRSSAPEHAWSGRPIKTTLDRHSAHRRSPPCGRDRQMVTSIHVRVVGAPPGRAGAGSRLSLPGLGRALRGRGITIQRGFRPSVPGHARARHAKTTLDRYSGIVIPKWNPTSYAREGDGTLLRSHHRARRTRLGRLHARPVQTLDQRRQPAVATADNPCRSGRGRTTGAGTKLAQKPLSRSKVPQIVRRNRAAGLSALAAMRTVASSARSTGRSATGRRRTR